MNKKDFKLLKYLCEINGVSGFENEATNFIFNYFKENKDFEITKDKFHNVIVKYFHSKGKPVISVFTHIDEVGLIVSDITNDGFIKFKTIGGWNPLTLYMMKVKFNNDKKTIGVISSEVSKNFTVDNLYIDCGYQSKKEAIDDGITIGTDIIPYSELTLLSGNKIMVKTLDNRISCFTLIKLLDKLSKNKIDANFIGVFSVQEEVGCRGSKISINEIDSDISFALDTTDSFDVPGLERLDCTINNGFALSLVDGGTIAHLGLFRYIENLLKKKKIKFQYDPMNVGGTDSSQIHIAKNGIINLTLSIPIRYMHTPYSIGSINDIDKTLKVLLAILKDLDKTKLNKIYEYKFKKIIK